MLDVGEHGGDLGLSAFSHHLSLSIIPASTPRRHVLLLGRISPQGARCRASSPCPVPPSTPSPFP